MSRANEQETSAQKAEAFPASVVATRDPEAKPQSAHGPDPHARDRHARDPHASELHAPHGGNLVRLSLASIGVVYGDIGTSPLYALRESLSHSKTQGLTDEAVIGTVSLLLWALFFTVTAKYVLFLMRADNKGEGGTLSLMALAQRALDHRSAMVFFLGVAGAALFSGDAIITPAISVLSALEGLKIS